MCTSGRFRPRRERPPWRSPSGPFRLGPGVPPEWLRQPRAPGDPGSGSPRTDSTWGWPRWVGARRRPSSSDGTTSRRRAVVYSAAWERVAFHARSPDSGSKGLLAHAPAHHGGRDSGRGGRGSCRAGSGGPSPSRELNRNLAHPVRGPDETTHTGTRCCRSCCQRELTEFDVVVPVGAAEARGIVVVPRTAPQHAVSRTCTRLNAALLSKARRSSQRIGMARRSAGCARAATLPNHG